MGSTYVEYVSRVGAKTTLKLAYCGYTYYKKSSCNGTKYYYCDLRSSCNASYIHKNGRWIPGRGGWTENKLHVSHKPDIAATVAKISMGNAMFNDGRRPTF